MKKYDIAFKSEKGRKKESYEQNGVWTDMNRLGL